MLRETISLELLTAKDKRPLGIRLEAVVQQWVSKRDMTYFYSSEQLVEMTKIVKEEMNINVEFVIVHNPMMNAVASIIAIPGHGGNTYQGPNTKPVALRGSGLPEELKKITIDLDKGRISGPYIEGFKNRITITTGLVTHAIGATAEEITGVILHELGHVFSQYMALGEYVWLNYYLQDGVDIVLGKKPNVYKLEILTEVGLTKYCGDKELAAELQRAPTKANVRRAILLSTASAPRHHLTTKENDTSKLREEQLADLFASRMGYGRAAATIQGKMIKVYGSQNALSDGSFALIETTKVLLGISTVLAVVAMPAFPPFILMAVIFNQARKALVVNDPENHDNDLERLNKIRRDLVAQLKVLSPDPKLEEKILEDIKVVDDMLVNYRQHTTVWETLQNVLAPSYRRKRHMRLHEQQLESLLNNDLAVVASKFNTLSRKLT